MTGRVKVSIDAPGVRLRFEGTTDLWEREILPLVGPVARGAWREGPVLEGDLEGPAGPQAAAAPAAAP
ncbi:MAG: hypothetical protein HUU06_12100, partial [Planctomycetaceae bacterium]|nr:hypothetical protein [Planctomycetaceae bacterium]